MERQLPLCTDRGYLCQHCGKNCLTLQKLSSLRRHMVIHTGIKPFPCSECGMKFSHKGTLLIHQRVHSREKPFSCPDCSKVFATLTLDEPSAHAHRREAVRLRGVRHQFQPVGGSDQTHAWPHWGKALQTMWKMFFFL
uniref:Zinc finger protein 2-like n=1 Tax=Astyanax mexicanus TaxID=7994 RepID=A0A3B1KJG2_ASTMX